MADSAIRDFRSMEQTITFGDNIGTMTRTAVVVGVGDGIGMALFRQFGEAGMNTAICTSHPESTESIVDGLSDAGVSALSIECDPRSPIDIAQGFADVIEAYETIDVVAFVAGSTAPNGLFGCTRKEFLDALDRDLLGGFCTTRAVIPKMKESGGGTLLFVNGSTALVRGRDDVGGSTTQAGLRGFTASIGEELDEVTITHISVGEIAAEIATDESRLRDEIAALCTDLVADGHHRRLESEYRIVFEGETPTIEPIDPTDTNRVDESSM